MAEALVFERPPSGIGVLLLRVDMKAGWTEEV